MVTTATSRRAPPAPAPIAAEPTGVEQLAAPIAEMKADQDADIAALRLEIAELRSLIAKPPEPASWAPEGHEALAKVAARLGYSCESVRLWCVTGTVPALRRGGVWYVHAESAAAYAHGK